MEPIVKHLWLKRRQLMCLAFLWYVPWFIKHYTYLLNYKDLTAPYQVIGDIY